MLDADDDLLAARLPAHHLRMGAAALRARRGQRRAARRRRRHRARRGRADGGVPVVTGVRLDGGGTIDADLVIASTGRRSDLPRWLAEHGVTVAETEIDAGVVYFSRWYRAEDENDFGFRVGVGGGLAVGVIGADAGTYSITAVVDKDDKELRAHLNDSDRFDATMRLLPEIADVIDFGGGPFHPVHCMTGLVNRLRRYTSSDGDPLAVGILAVGDAHTCTNPAYGRASPSPCCKRSWRSTPSPATRDLAAAARQYEASPPPGRAVVPLLGDERPDAPEDPRRHAPAQEQPTPRPPRRRRRGHLQRRDLGERRPRARPSPPPGREPPRTPRRAVGPPARPPTLGRQSADAAAARRADRPAARPPARPARRSSRSSPDPGPP